MKVCARSARFFKDINLFREEKLFKNALQEAIESNLLAGKLKSCWDLLCAGNWNHALEIYCAREIEIMYCSLGNWNHTLEIYCARVIEIMHLRSDSTMRGKLKIHCGKYCAMGTLRFTNYKYAAWGTGNWKSIVLSTVLLLFTVHGKSGN